MMLPKHRLVILTNILAPYRIPLYLVLARKFEILVIEGNPEDNRDWAAQSNIGGLKLKRTWGFQVARYQKTSVDGVRDKKYVHFNLGLIMDLPLARPQIIVTNEMGVRTLIALLYGAVSNKPVWVWSACTVNTEQNTGAIKRLVRSIIARSARHWITYGEAASEYLLSLGISRNSILQLQNCIEESFFQPTESARLEGETLVRDLPRPIALCVGQLIPRKGLNLLLESAARLRAEGHKFSIVFAGSGSERPALESLALGLGLSNVRFLGSLSRKDLTKLYQASDFLVFPTLDEPWGLVVNEALWSGLKVLCSKYAGCARELVPLAAQFDPLDPSSFDMSLRMAINDELPPIDPSKLLPMETVANMLGNSLEKGAPVRLPTC